MEPRDIPDNLTSFYYTNIEISKKDDNVFLTNGGRVLAISSLAKNYKQAIGLSYKQIEKISFEKAYFRKDIGFDL